MIDGTEFSISERKWNIELSRKCIDIFNRDYNKAMKILDGLMEQVKKGEKVRFPEEVDEMYVFDFDRIMKEIRLFDSFFENRKKETMKRFHRRINYLKGSIDDLEHEKIVTKQQDFWIEGFYDYQSDACKELGTALGIDVSVIRDNLPHYMTIYTTPPPDIQEFFKSMGTRGAGTFNYYLHVDDRVCTITMNRYYTCRILYIMVRSVMKNEDIMNEADDVKLFCKGILIPETNQSISEIFRNTNEMSMEIIHHYPQISYKKYRITSIRQFRSIPSSVNYLILDYRKY